MVNTVVNENMPFPYPYPLLESPTAVPEVSGTHSPLNISGSVPDVVASVK